MIATPLKALAAAALTVSAMSWPSGHVQPNTNAVQQEVSAAEIDRTLRAIDVDRTSGSEGERASAKYLDRRLAEYGIAHMLYDSHLYLSWPGRAELVVPALGTIRGKTAAFAAATPKDGLRGRVVFEPKLTRRVDQSLAFDSDVRGRTCAESPTRRRSCSPARRLARSLFYRSIETQMQPRSHEDTKDARRIHLKEACINSSRAYHRGRGGRGGQILKLTGFFLLSSVSSVVEFSFFRRALSSNASAID